MTNGAGTRPAGAANRSPTVLVVDDSDTIRRFTALALRHRAHVGVLEAASGAEALALAAAFRPALVLLDGALPDARGIDVLRALRSNPATAGIPVVVITGSSELDVEFLAAGATDFIVKPVAIDTLFALVDTFVPSGTLAAVAARSRGSVPARPTAVQAPGRLPSPPAASDASRRR